MSDQFITMVIAMREAQREWEENPTRGNMVARDKCVSRVDEWIQNYMAVQVQLEMWSRSMGTDETPGAYNVSHDGKATEDPNA